MKIEIVTEPVLQKACVLERFFRSITANMHFMMDAPMLVGETFFNSYRIFSSLFPLEDGRAAYEDTIMALYNRDYTDTYRISKEKAKAITDLEKLDIPVIGMNDRLVADFDKEIKECFNSHSDRINGLLSEIFGFRLPEEVSLVVRQGHAGATSADMMVAQPRVIIGFSIDPGYPIMKKASVVLHEIIHAMIKANGNLDYKASQHGVDVHVFEEALLDYFAPYGILTEKLGFMEKRDIGSYHIDAVRCRPESKMLSERLLSTVKDYYESQFRQTIWDFLKETEFGSLVMR